MVEVGTHMAQEKSTQSHAKPEGFTPQSGGLASEYAREQGWGLNEDERRKTSAEKQAFDGGADYDYGAADFGDAAVDTKEAKPPAQSENNPAGQEAGKEPAKPVKIFKIKSDLKRKTA
jgi:hypothetical protein